MKNNSKKCYLYPELLREKCLYLEFFLSVFSRIQNQYEEIRSISPYSVRMRENTDQKTPNMDNFHPMSNPIRKQKQTSSMY